MISSLLPEFSDEIYRHPCCFSVARRLTMRFRHQIPSYYQPSFTVSTIQNRCSGAGLVQTLGCPVLLLVLLLVVVLLPAVAAIPAAIKATREGSVTGIWDEIIAAASNWHGRAPPPSCQTDDTHSWDGTAKRFWQPDTHRHCGNKFSFEYLHFGIIVARVYFS